MVGIILNHRSSDLDRRGLLFGGDYLVQSASVATLALAAHAQTMIRDAFSPMNPELAQDGIEVAQFIERVAPLKTAFTNNLRTKELIRDILVEYGSECAGFEKSL